PFFARRCAPPRLLARRLLYRRQTPFTAIPKEKRQMSLCLYRLRRPCSAALPLLLAIALPACDDSKSDEERLEDEIGDLDSDTDEPYLGEETAYRELGETGEEPGDATADAEMERQRRLPGIDITPILAVVGGGSAERHWVGSFTGAPGRTRLLRPVRIE